MRNNEILLQDGLKINHVSADDGFNNNFFKTADKV